MAAVTLSLAWKGDMKFANSPGSPLIELHSGTRGIMSPPEALAYAVMACMAMDIVHVVQKSRQELSDLTVTFQGERAAEHPRRFVRMAIHFAVRGSVEAAVVERAIALSRETYCSVWNTIRPDLPLQTTFDIAPGP